MAKKKKKKASQQYKHILEMQQQVQDTSGVIEDEQKQVANIKNSALALDAESGMGAILYLKKDLLKVAGFVGFVLVVYGILYYFVNFTHYLPFLSQ